ncbi:MAG: hypothetical protein ACI4PV_07825 [Butyricicoccus sp.]
MKRNSLYAVCITAICALVILNVTHILTGGSSQTVHPGENDTYGLPDNNTAYTWLADATASAEPTESGTFEREGTDGKSQEESYEKYDPSLLENAGIENVREYGELSRLGDGDSFAVAYTTESGELVICNYGKDGSVKKAVNTNPKKDGAKIETYEYNTAS